MVLEKCDPPIRRVRPNARVQTQLIVFTGSSSINIRGNSGSRHGTAERRDRGFGGSQTPGSTAGLPGLVVAAGTVPAGLPIALEFDGQVGADRSLLALGLTVERVLGAVPAPKLYGSCA